MCIIWITLYGNEFGLTEEDHIKPPNKITIDINSPLKNKSLLSSQPPPTIVNPNIRHDSNADRIQKKQKASILINIIPINKKLKIAMQFETKNKHHQANLELSILFLFSHGKKGTIDKVTMNR